MTGPSLLRMIIYDNGQNGLMRLKRGKFCVKQFL